MIVVEIADSISATLPSEILRNAQLERVAQETLCIAGASSEGDLTILISDDEHLRRLNHQFLGIDEPTDVLSFPAAISIRIPIPLPG